MLFDKVYTETIDIRDPDGYAAGPEAFVLTHLRRRYVGRCRKGAFILAILRVLRRSRCRIKETDLSGSGFVDVEFVARVSVCGQWDIVTGVEIVDRGRMILGRSTTEGAMIVSFLPSPGAEAVRSGQIIAARILRVQYTPDQLEASALGHLLTCDKRAPVYQLDGSLSGGEARELRELAVRVEKELAARAALSGAEKDTAFFLERRLYSYARGEEGAVEGAQEVRTAGRPPWEGPPGVPLPSGAAAVNLLELVETAAGAKKDTDVGGLWSRDLALYRSSPLVARAAVPPSGWVAAVAVKPRAAFGLMLQSMLTFLKAVNEMAGTYSPPEARAAHANIWLAMEGAQLPRP
jgi:hypothetical protein